MDQLSGFSLHMHSHVDPTTFCGSGHTIDDPFLIQRSLAGDFRVCPEVQKMLGSFSDSRLDLELLATLCSVGAVTRQKSHLLFEVQESVCSYFPFEILSATAGNSLWSGSGDPPKSLSI